MNSSRAFLHGIYRMYVQRACENLGVPSKGTAEEKEEDAQGGYPTEFKKLALRSKNQERDEYSSTEDFLRQIGEFDSSIIIAKKE